MRLVLLLVMGCVSPLSAGVVESFPVEVGAVYYDPVPTLGATTQPSGVPLTFVLRDAESGMWTAQSPYGTFTLQHTGTVIYCTAELSSGEMFDQAMPGDQGLPGLAWVASPDGVRSAAVVVTSVRYGWWEEPQRFARIFGGGLLSGFCFDIGLLGLRIVTRRGRQHVGELVS